MFKLPELPQLIEFLAKLREARALVLQDAESFHEASTVLEHIGQAIARKMGKGLGTYKKEIVNLAVASGYTDKVSVGKLFDDVKGARNKAVHDGAYVRHVNSRLVDLLLILEESIMMGMKYAKDLMVRNPQTAESWHSVSEVRRKMLANSFSTIPIYLHEGAKWSLLTDTAIMQLVRKDRHKYLPMSIKEVISLPMLNVVDADCCRPDTFVDDLVAKMNTHPVLVTERIQNEDRLLGIITAFDLL